MTTPEAPTRVTLTRAQLDRLDGARLRVVVSSQDSGRAACPYYSRPLMALSRPIPTTSIPTVGVDDRWRLYVNPEFVDRSTAEELAAAFVHEIHHLLRVHPDRAKSIGVTANDHAVWNICADAEINQDLDEEGWDLPDWAVRPEHFGAPNGKPAEWYWEFLRKDNGGSGSGDGDGDGENDQPGSASGSGAGGDTPPGDCGSCAGGETRDWEATEGPASGETGIDPSHADVLRRQTANDVAHHAKQKGRGTVPAGLLRWAEELLTPKVDWRRTLASMIRNAVAFAAGKTDYTYSRMSRRTQPGGVMFPALRSPIPEVAVVMDTSGSMGDAAIGQTLGEIEGILRQVGCGNGAVSVLTVDAAVQGVQKVTTAKRVEVLGGGGTDMRVGIEEAIRLRPRPNVIVVLSDGGTPWPEQPPAIPVVAGILHEADVDFSRAFPTPEWMPVVHIEVDP